ncbi:MaoC family dehydratase [Stutzerimonas tarimensis]|uniref:MaoC family dehydratase n=1 Tax=Stutzerimonas tarimensis TaxID=1507735 RepID=A0ABV7TCK0_9GAMM
MTQASVQQTGIGQALPGFTTPPISRLDLALYCGASADHNPIHVDIDFARASGMEDVFAHGMLSMAWLGRVLTDWVPQRQLRSFQVRFVAVTQLKDCIRCEATVREVFEEDGERRARLDLRTLDQQGQVKLQGEAVVALAA